MHMFFSHSFLLFLEGHEPVHSDSVYLCPGDIVLYDGIISDYDISSSYHPFRMSFVIYFNFFG